MHINSNDLDRLKKNNEMTFRYQCATANTTETFSIGIL